MSRQAQVIWNELGANINKFNPAFIQYLHSLHLTSSDPRAIALVAGQVAQQAEMIAMLDVFKLIAWSFVLMLPLMLLLRTKKSVPGEDVPVAIE
jgi:DHA2 family multidrug resistance protein